jgi:hypothetical protein
VTDAAMVMLGKDCGLCSNARLIPLFLLDGMGCISPAAGTGRDYFSLIRLLGCTPYAPDTRFGCWIKLPSSHGIPRS